MHYSPDPPRLAEQIRAIPVNQGSFFMRMRLILPVLVAFCATSFDTTIGDDIDHLQGEMAAEVTATTAIVQTRLTGSTIDENGDVPGAKGFVQFEYATDEQFTDSIVTSWTMTAEENDFIARAFLRDLKPGTRYYYRIRFGKRSDQTQTGPVRTFTTLPGEEASQPISFVVVTGMHHYRFHNATKQWDKAMEANVIPQGYPALKSILDLKPAFFIGTGDNVYYDHPANEQGIDPESMRKKWHQQFVQRNYVNLFAEVPAYWEKDDHDHRYNDNDNTGDRKPSSELGIKIYHEQLPLYDDDADREQQRPYRSHRITKELQVWLLEGRDFRDPNNKVPGPDKTMWGIEQREWLKRTLKESDAMFKLVISPTPMVGPDDMYKKDNHTNPNGFLHEGEAFFTWAKETGLKTNELLLICGDRHWQYHSIHPSGFQEFSSGALVDANSRLGRNPGSKGSTDPDGLIKQPYTSVKPSGGFLHVIVNPATAAGKAAILFHFRDENGELLHEHSETN